MEIYTPIFELRKIRFYKFETYTFNAAKLRRKYHVNQNKNASDCLLS